MKTCDEMINSLLERRKQYEAAQRARRRMLVRVAAICSLGLALLGGLAAARLPARPDTSITSPTSPSDLAPADTLTPERDADSADVIIIHPLGSVGSDRLNICLQGKDFVPLDKAALLEYYGTRIFPAVPADLLEWNSEEGFGVYRRNGGTGEVYWDGLVLNYSNSDYTRNVNIELKKNSLPLCDFGFFSYDEEKSVINGTEAVLGRSESGYYYALFIHRGVGFQIICDGLTQEEFLSVVSSLTE